MEYSEKTGAESAFASRRRAKPVGRFERAGAKRGNTTLAAAFSGAAPFVFSVERPRVRGPDLAPDISLICSDVINGLSQSDIERLRFRESNIAPGRRLILYGWQVLKDNSKGRANRIQVSLQYNLYRKPVIPERE